ncbi:ATP-binding domain-containing protein [Kitasatospora sp. NPDC096147]|uniref:ATP-binding domain-containing protein n=1 Tax=Kitasatospora sp. NPDC096147 TaxID=3364093 RepID=UPI003828D8CF
MGDVKEAENVAEGAPEPGTDGTTATPPAAPPAPPAPPATSRTEPGADTAATVAALAEAIRTVGGATATPATGRDTASGPNAAPAAGPVDGQREQALREAAEVLTAGGAPADFAPAAVAVLGEGAAGALREDPWAVLTLPGVRPDQADNFARGLLGPAAGPGDPRRARALVPWLLEQSALRGDSAAEIGEVATGLERLGLPDAAAALQEVVMDGLVMAFQEELPGHRPSGNDEDDEPPMRTLLALERLALAEESLADGLVRVMSTFVPGTDEEYQAAREAVPTDRPGQDHGRGENDEGTEDVKDTGDPEDAGETASAGTGGATEEAAEDTDPAADRPADAPSAPAAPAGQDEARATEEPVQPGPTAWEAAAVAAPSSSATALVRAVAEHPVVLHTGGEAARAEPAVLLTAARGLGLRAWATTWTAEGRDVLRARTGAAEVAVLGELLAGADGPGRAPDGSLALDLLIVLDAPLIDVELAATLLEALADSTRLVLSGDPGQLWSAGPGRFFADLLAAKTCPAVASRTPDFGPIGELVSSVGIGELQPVDAPEKEVVILTAKDGGEAVHRAVQLLTDSIPRALGIPAEQVVLLTPGHGGTAGTRALNAAAKARLNPGPGRFGGFDPGDRVVHSPAPGVLRLGRVLDGDAAGLHVELTDGDRLTLPPAKAGELRHAWALTGHQAVGRRWPGVVAVLPEDAAAGLTRQWVYTVFGRAERHLSVVHAAGPALAHAVAERPARPRTTRLRSILAEQAEQAY